MRTRLRKWSLLLSVAAFLALPLASGAQLATRAGLGEEACLLDSHIGNITGHAKAGAAEYRRYYVGCHGRTRRWQWRRALWLAPSPATSSWVCSVSARPHRNFPTDEIFSTRLVAASTARPCRSGQFTKRERADLVAWVKHFSPRWVNRSPELPSRFLPSPKSPRTASRPGATYLLGCSAGSATACRAWPTGRRPLPFRMISAGRSRPSTLPTELGRSAATPIRISPRISMTGLDIHLCRRSPTMSSPMRHGTWCCMFEHLWRRRARKRDGEAAGIEAGRCERPGSAMRDGLTSVATIIGRALIAASVAIC